jgi:hypothetical protein
MRYRCFVNGELVETRRTIELVCGTCGWSLTRETGEVAP